ncbi:MAG: GNAT family N-acetyltransferase [Lachnospiraceae bacterium]|nr:GNAT family N-acetyltransferase [Lachnospiraceae bacterium]
MNYEIVHLPKEKWKGYILPIGYTTKQYYDVSVEEEADGFRVVFKKKDFDMPVTHTPEEYDFADRLYNEYRANAYAWGILEGDRLVAAIETDEETWSNRLRVTELWVAPEYQKKGMGHALMEMAKEQARRERRRAVILETQSCNVNAVDFYRHEGFTLIGMDTCCYGKDDLKRKEVRMELGWFPKRKKSVSKEEIEIRKETPDDWYQTELMTQHAFWNKHCMGCSEHYLVHKIRESEDYIPELSRIAVKDGKVIGLIMYSKAYVMDGETKHDLLTFGPLCVEPEWQGTGVGRLLLEETMDLARKAGYAGIALYGEPDYYPRIGFQTCDHFNITTPDGKNFDAFMAIELNKGAMKDIKGKFYESKDFDDLPEEEVEKMNQKFPPLKKLRFPGQWF